MLDDLTFFLRALFADLSPTFRESGLSATRNNALRRHVYGSAPAMTAPCMSTERFRATEDFSASVVDSGPGLRHGGGLEMAAKAP